MARSRALGDGTFDGVLVVDKPVGPTSHDMVDLVRRLTGVRRVGHGGTLDPFAAGVLPVFIGRATRLVEYHMADDKAYRAMIAFGATSTTDDLDGELTVTDGPAPDQAAVEAALAPFRGRISQVPPDHSAVRVQGRHAYELARGGERPALSARQVEIQRLELVAWDDADPARPTATVEIACSAGTYIRAIARDLGAALGCGAYLVALTRSQSGPFTRDGAHVPDAIRAAFATGRGAEPPAAGRRRSRRLPERGPRRQAISRRSSGARSCGRRPAAPAVVEPSVPGSTQGRPLPGPRRQRSPGRDRAARGRPAPPGEGARRAGIPSLSVERHARLEALAADLRSVATIGAFDGMHRGHVALIDRLVREARQRGTRGGRGDLRATSRSGPAGHAAELLCDPAERDARLADLGVDHLVVERFDADLAAQTAETFVRRLNAGGRLVALLMTEASAFGRGRGGTLSSMRALGAAEGFEVVEVPQRRAGGEVISSSRIRAAIVTGRLAEARRLLGRSYAVTGTVVHGDGRGRALGFPTANLAFAAPVALPPDGIYAVHVDWGGEPTHPSRRKDGVASLGVRPTFGVGARVLEVFLLDTDEDLYDLRLRVTFVRRQRGERRFEQVGQLVEQMERDVVRARRILGRAPA